MKNNFKTTVYIIVTIICFGINVQVKSQKSELILPESSGEDITILSDRSMYAVNEEIYFSCIYNVSLLLPVDQWSSVMYAELIGWDGVKYGQTKVSIQNGLASGSIDIPEGLKSGYYYLRAYTRWMRNYDPLAYAHVPLKIINPASEELYPGRNGHEESSDINYYTLKKQDELKMRIDGLKSEYNKREEVLIEFQIDKLPENLRMIASVIPANLPVQAGGYFQTKKPAEGGNQMIEYYPEKEGILLSAKVVNKISREPAAGMKVTLSSFTDAFYFGATTSDETGMVFFNLPTYHGENEFYIVPEGERKDSVDILVNSDYCQKSVSLPFISFELTDEENQLMQQIAINAQLMHKFDTSNNAYFSNPEFKHPFYGEPYAVTYTDEFIRLKNLKEFYYELVPSVSVMSFNKNPFLFIHSETSLRAYPPLILIDNIPVYNDVEMLSIPSNMIERIELVNGGYIVGQYKYSGVLSMYSKERDIANYKLPENSYFFNYSMFDADKFSAPEYNSGPSDSRFPDLRNTLYWNPDVDISENGSGELKFYTSDVQDEYRILLRGLTEDGKLMVFSSTFVVK
ncbi:MAG TPA: Plug domain-containing protein [Bacteroidales bacterium]|nr:Plug domain-containing protein [Bacteroidales bacterium]